MASMLAAFIAEMSILTFRTYKQGWTKRYPLPAPIPADYIGTAMVYAVLALLNEAEAIRPLPAIMGWGFVLATGLNLFDPRTLAVKNGPSAASMTSGLFTQPAAPGQPATPPGLQQGPA